MLSKVLSGAILATLFSATLLPAQSIAQLGGPANLPPASFKGQQFADNRGCIFLRAGFGNTTNWVPRVDRTRKPLCGFPPTFGAAVAAAVEADMALQGPTQGSLGVFAVVPAPTPTPTATPAPGVTAPAAPVRTAMAAPTPAPGPTIISQPTTAVAPALRTTPTVRVTMAAPSPAPGPTVFANARTAAAQPAQTATGYRSRVAAPTPAPRPTIFAANPTPAPSAPTAPRRGFLGFLFGAAQPGTRPMSATVATGIAVAPVQVAAPAIVVARNAIPTPPKGYKLAWKDDRLNPQRAIGTAAGQAAQDRIWTRTTPAVLVAVAAPAIPTLRTSVSTMSAPQASAARSGAAYVQIGSFGQPANASGAAARLTALGLPVSTTRITRSGKVLQVVRAGPFATPAAAQSALATLRGAGFGDAILK